MAPSAAKVFQLPEPQSSAPNMAWQVVGAVVRGVAHERLGLPCQDAEDYRVLPGGILLVALADGAGSARFSDQGARCAVNEALHALAGALEDGLPENKDGWQRLLRETFATARAAVLRLAETNKKENIDVEPVEAVVWEDLDAPAGLEVEPEAFGEPDHSDEWLDLIGNTTELDRAAEEEPARPPERDYATTLTCVVATPDRLVAGQIGDGVVVAGDGEALFAVTRLQRGEYANETHFLTQTDALEWLTIEIVEQPVSALAVMSDGLIRLALKMPAQEPYAPFFRPLFQVTGTIENEAQAARQLSAFLGSERVNARTDDDKSLVLAVRISAVRTSPRVSGGPALAEEHTMVEDRSNPAAGSIETGEAGGTDGTERSASSLDWDKK